MYVVVNSAEYCVCGGSLQPKNNEAVTMSVLDVGGWRQVHHMPFRCRGASCCWREKRAWHNYWVEGNAAWWWWLAGHAMKYFFTCHGWGVTTARLRQMSRRLVHHYASFRGEAAVHCAEAEDQGLGHIVPAKAHLKLFYSWILWRLVGALAGTGCEQGKRTHVRATQQSESERA